MSFRSQWKEYFSFTRRERNGVFILLSILLLQVLYLSTAHRFYPEKIPVSRAFETELARFEQKVQQVLISDSLHRDSVFKSKYRRTTYFQDSGRKFRPAHPRNNPALRVEINSADTTEFKKLKGIGSSFAKRMVKYRELLGGYIRLDQILEVYGMDSARYQSILPHLGLDLTRVQKIPINQCNEEDLKKHPYIRWKLARTIIAYRSHHGLYSSVNDLRKIDLVTDSVFAKIAPYLEAP